MSFKVDPDALVKFSKMIDGYAEDAEAVKKFFTAKTEVDTHGQGLLTALAGQHEDQVKEMSERTALMISIGWDSSATVLDVADYYRSTDEANAASLDDAYEKSSYDSTRDDVAPPLNKDDDDFVDKAFAELKYTSAQSELEINKKPSDIEPKGSEIEDWARYLIDWVSAAAWLREIPPVDDAVNWVIEWFTGDWKMWARCALAWQACSETVYSMSGEFDHIDITLEQVWEGNAADAAIKYFLALKDATSTEGDAFDSLYQQCLHQMEYCYEASQTLSDLVNLVVDLAFDALLALLGGFTGNAYAIGLAIFNVISKIGTVLTVVMNVVQMAETIISNSDVPEVPKCDLEHLSTTMETNSYHHPEIS
ncbi:hypothetical protein [Actinophytocola sediminis]